MRDDEIIVWILMLLQLKGNLSRGKSNVKWCALTRHARATSESVKPDLALTLAIIDSGCRGTKLPSKNQYHWVP